MILTWLSNVSRFFCFSKNMWELVLFFAPTPHHVNRITSSSPRNVFQRPVFLIKSMSYFFIKIINLSIITFYFLSVPRRHINYFCALTLDEMECCFLNLRPRKYSFRMLCQTSGSVNLAGRDWTRQSGWLSVWLCPRTHMCIITWKHSRATRSVEIEWRIFSF